MKKSAHQNRAPFAYKNEAFLDSWNGRSLRILSEYLEPLDRFSQEKIRDTVVFFGRRDPGRGSAGQVLQGRQGIRAADHAMVGRDGAADAPFRRLYGRGPGIMEAANRGRAMPAENDRPEHCAAARAVPESLSFARAELPVQLLFMRKFWFAYLAKALVVFPGGFGTLDELTEILTLVQTQKLEKKIMIIMYGTEFWKEVINFDALAKYGVIAPEDMKLMDFVDDPHTALDHLKDFLSRNYLQPHQVRALEEMPDIAKSRI